MHNIFDSMVYIPYNDGRTDHILEFFELADDNYPVKDFIERIDNVKLKAKVHRNMMLLKSWGVQLTEPYAKYLVDGIYELRSVFGNNQARIMYFFYEDKHIVLTNGFIKKTQKTPINEIHKAQVYRKLYLKRRDDHYEKTDIR